MRPGLDHLPAGVFWDHRGGTLFLGVTVVLLREYSQVRKEIGNGDLLLFRGESFVSRWIGVYGRGPYSHAAMAGWWGESLMCLEVRELKGGRAVMLSSQATQYPDRIDVYRPAATQQQRDAACESMIRKTGAPYSYRGILAAALRHLPFIRWHVKPDWTPGSSPCADVPCVVPDQPEFCSQAIATSWLSAGVDPVPNLSDRLTEPNDLARSYFFSYLFTLASKGGT